jgi:putative membrane protein
MFGYEFCGCYWWIFPLVMIVLCFLFMRGCIGRRMCCWGTGYDLGESALDVLNKRYAKGEIDQQEYEEKKKELTSK